MSTMPEPQHMYFHLIAPLVIGLIIFILILFVYLIPAFVAKRRDHINKKAILILNIFLGWTFIGYVVALIWAFTNPSANAKGNLETRTQPLDEEIKK